MSHVGQEGLAKVDKSVPRAFFYQDMEAHMRELSHTLATSTYRV